MKRWGVLSGLLLVLLAVGIRCYRDYGVPWDEEAQLQIAVQNHRYIFHQDPGLLTFRDRYYGPFFELPLLWLTARLPVPESALLRHLLIFIIFTGGVAIFYLLALRMLRGVGWALLAALFLVASPRIFGDAFYNSKDIPFMVACITAVWLTLQLTDLVGGDSQAPRQARLSLAAALVSHSMAGAALTSTRVAGILLPALSALLLILAGSHSIRSLRRSLFLVGLDLSLTAGLTLLFWPVLWHNPLNEFIRALSLMSNYPFTMRVLYQGEFYSVGTLPWHYLPVWFGFTTPLITLGLGALGLALGIGRQVPLLWTAWQERRLLSVLRQPDRLGWLGIGAWLAAPVAAVWVLDTALYDGWRHLYFAYPAWVLIAAGGLKIVSGWLADHPVRIHPARLNLGLLALGALVAAGLAEPVGFMLRWHPHQNVYFNLLAGSPASLRQRFELDYWGLAYKQAIDAILEYDNSTEIPVFLANPPGRLYIDTALPPQQSARLKKLSDSAEARYFITEFRWHPQDYPFSPAWYSLKVRGVEIMAVYRLK